MQGDDDGILWCIDWNIVCRVETESFQMSLKSSIVNNYKVTRQGWESNIHMNERKKIEVHLVLNEHVDRCRIFTMTHMGDNIVGYLPCSLLDTAWGGRGWWPGSAATSPLSSHPPPADLSRPGAMSPGPPWSIVIEDLFVHIRRRGRSSPFIVYKRVLKDKIW